MGDPSIRGNIDNEFSERRYKIPHQSILMPNLNSSINNLNPLRTEMERSVESGTAGHPLRCLPCFHLRHVAVPRRFAHGLSIKDGGFLSFFDQTLIHFHIKLSSYIPTKKSRPSNLFKLSILSHTEKFRRRVKSPEDAS